MKTLFGVGILLVGIAVGTSQVSVLHAQDRIDRVELRKAELGGTNDMEVIMATLEIQPGGEVPRHFHHGEEFLYVLEGASFQASSRDPVTLKSGASLHFAREEPHGGFKIVGEVPLKILTVHIVDKGKPLVQPVN